MFRSNVLIAVTAVGLYACGGGGGSTPPTSTPTTSTPTTTTSSTAPATSAEPATSAAPAASASAPTASTAPKMSLDEQVAAGEKVYKDKCAMCHGQKGEGKAKAPALIGKKALDDYRNGKEAFTYIHDNMPPKAPSSLTSDEYWSVTAYLIKKNDLPIKETLTPTTSESVKWSR